MKAGLGQGRGKQIPMVDAPQDRTFQPGQDACREQGGGSPVQGAIATPGNFVERPQSEPAAGQPGVHVRFPEGQNPALDPASGLDPADMFAQGIHLGGGYGHGWNGYLSSGTFFFCSN